MPLRWIDPRLAGLRYVIVAICLAMLLLGGIALLAIGAREDATNAHREAVSAHAEAERAHAFAIATHRDAERAKALAKQNQRKINIIATTRPVILLEQAKACRKIVAELLTQNQQAREKLQLNLRLLGIRPTARALKVFRLQIRRSRHRLEGICRAVTRRAHHPNRKREQK